MYNRLIKYIDKHSILFDNQYGFRKTKSTSLALLDLIDKITSAIDKKGYAVGIFLDLSKAFDTINHEIIFEKLNHYGICGLALNWLRNYFSNRQQYVECNGVTSLFNTIRCGVPQGSVLGPLLFLIYI